MTEFFTATLPNSTELNITSCINQSKTWATICIENIQIQFLSLFKTIIALEIIIILAIFTLYFVVPHFMDAEQEIKDKVLHILLIILFAVVIFQGIIIILMQKGL